MTSEEEIVKVVDDLLDEAFGAAVKEVDQPDEMTKVKHKVNGSPKVKAKRKKDTQPKMNDWVRIKNSGGNSLPNDTIQDRD